MPWRILMALFLQGTHSLAYPVFLNTLDKKACRTVMLSNLHFFFFPAFFKTFLNDYYPQSLCVHHLFAKGKQKLVEICIYNDIC